jgi:hypothetical protein
MKQFQMQAVQAGTVVTFDGQLYLVTAVVNDGASEIYVIQLSGGHAAYHGRYFPANRMVGIHRSGLTGL